MLEIRVAKWIKEKTRRLRWIKNMEGPRLFTMRWGASMHMNLGALPSSLNPSNAIICLHSSMKSEDIAGSRLTAQEALIPHSLGL